jgi:hypothetical protein
MAATATARTARSSAAARRVATRRAPARKPAPRRSAPAKRRRSGHTPITGFVPVAAVGGAVGGIADSGLFVWLTRGRLWIGLLGTLLVGIVGLNVVALSFSASSSNAGQAADALRRQNSALRAQIAGKLSNSEIQAVAAKLGLTMPAAGSFGYVRPSPGDAKDAAQRLRDGDLTVTDTAAAVPVETAVVDPAVDPAAVAVDPAATADPAVATTDPATAAPVEPATDPAVAPPAETTAAPVSASSGGGAVGAP